MHGSPAEQLRMVGITGTNGKTTTAYLIDSAWRALGHVTGLIGTVETRVADERVKSVRTTPESPDLHALLAVMRERGVDTCTMEVSSHALELHRVDPVVYDVAAFTNLSQDHLDFHGTMEQYYAAKASLFTPQRARRGVVCVDDAWGRRLAAEATVPLVTVTSRPDVEADWHVEPCAGDGGRFDLVAGSRRLPLRSALPGDFNQLNTAVAALVLAASGVADDDVVRAVHAEPHVPGRMERVLVEGDGAPLAVVDFAHTADAVAAALGALRRQTAGRAHRRPRCRWRPRPRQAAGDGRRRARRAPTSSSSPTTTPARRTPPPSAPRCSPAPAPWWPPARRPGPGRAPLPPTCARSADAPPRSAPPSPSPARATPSRSSARATRPARRSTGPSTPSTTATSCAQP